jgi:hypothetical protein
MVNKCVESCYLQILSSANILLSLHLPPFPLPPTHPQAERKCECRSQSSVSDPSANPSPSLSASPQPHKGDTPTLSRYVRGKTTVRSQHNPFPKPFFSLFLCRSVSTYPLLTSFHPPRFLSLPRSTVLLHTLSPLLPPPPQPLCPILTSPSSLPPAAHHCSLFLRAPPHRESCLHGQVENIGGGQGRNPGDITE